MLECAADVEAEGKGEVSMLDARNEGGAECVDTREKEEMRIDAVCLLKGRQPRGVCRRDRDRVR